MSAYSAAKRYFENFNRQDEENVIQEISNADAVEWLLNNVPLILIPDKALEEMYYFRWWTLRKHIKKTPKGYIFTEFHPNVSWAGEYNAISCAAGHHIREARWLRDHKYADDYIRFWYMDGADTSRHMYSQWIGGAVYDKCLLARDFTIAKELLISFIRDYELWEKESLHESGLFWSYDDSDGMEFSISGSGLRATQNSYMCDYARVISDIAEMAGDNITAEIFRRKAIGLKELMQNLLYDPATGFFKTISLSSKNEKVENWDFSKRDPEKNVNELWGLFPWYFGIPDDGMEKGWERVMKFDGFFCCCGLTTAEITHKRFMFQSTHECLWNGYSWPFATSMALSAMARLIREHDQNYVDKADFYEILKLYTNSQHLTKDDGTRVNWIDESLNPITGEWYSRNILKQRGWMDMYGGYERGKDYNHSSYCDIVLGDLLGIQPTKDELSIIPMVPDDWEYFHVEGISFGGKSYTIKYENGEIKVL